MHLLRILLIFMTCSMSLPAKEALPARTWTSMQGTKVKAKVLRMEKDNVVMKKANGKIMRVPIYQFVQADRKIINDHFSTKPPKKEEPKEDKDEDMDDNDDKEEDDEDKDDDDDDDDDDKKGRHPKQKDVDGKNIKIPYLLGETKKDIEISRKLKMDIYVPSTLRAGEKYAVMIVVDPRNGSHRMMDKLIDAAETNEMIIATLPKISLLNYPRGTNPRNWPKNQVFIDKEALAPYIKSAMRKLDIDFPIDAKRIYTAGIGNSVHLAMWAMHFIDGAGVLAINGGGKNLFHAGNSDALLLLCNPKSIRRWDVASTFKQSRNSSLSFLRFYDGKTPDEDTLYDAVLMLNGMFTLKHKKGTHENISLRYEKMLMEHIDGIASDPELVMPWFEFLEKFELSKEKNTTKLEKWKKELMEEKESQLMIDGRKACIKSLLKYYDNGWNGYIQNNGKRSIEVSITKLAEKFKDTVWEDHLKSLAKAAQ